MSTSNPVKHNTESGFEKYNYKHRICLCQHISYIDFSVDSDYMVKCIALWHICIYTQFDIKIQSRWIHFMYEEWFVHEEHSTYRIRHEVLVVMMHTFQCLALAVIQYIFHSPRIIFLFFSTSQAE